MKQQELADAFRSECDGLAALVAAKNGTYSGQNGNGAFHNFQVIDHITNGHITREAGCFVRITDKVTRLWALLDGNVDQVGESFADTCVDLAGYALLLKLMYEDGRKQRDDAMKDTAAQPAEPERFPCYYCGHGDHNLCAGRGCCTCGCEPSLKPMQKPEPEPTSAWERLTGVLRR